jgi:isopentenyl diphosphate isomerase/L-lactate dehydrogenase-like FMN-dependent dehydrogenase
MVASTSSTQSLEDIAKEAVGPLWFQLYVSNRRTSEQLVHRATSAGYRALVLTVDSPRWGRKESAIRCGFRIPLKSNYADEDGAEENISLTWESLAWLRSLTTLPIVLKGILTAEDAVLAVRNGVDGIIVSNHGGRQLDGVSASIEALSEVVEAVNGDCEVYLDGGIRRGTDILKAIALGARAVLVGRPILWGLAVNGTEGVYHVLDLLRTELELAMTLAGYPTLGSIDRSLVKMNGTGGILHE